MSAPDQRHQASPAELKTLLEAQRRGRPFLVYRDDKGSQRILSLGTHSGRRTIGRGAGNDIALDWDSNVSRVHAVLERVGEVWTLVDDGLSRNGSFVNGERVDRRRRLTDRDAVRVGETGLTFHAPRQSRQTATAASVSQPAAPELTPAQRRVLRSLCRPCRHPGEPGVPATNPEIAQELHVSVEAVKAHLRTLFAKFGLDQLPQNAKRHALAGEALRTGAIAAHELVEP